MHEPRRPRTPNSGRSVPHAAIIGLLLVLASLTACGPSGPGSDAWVEDQVQAAEERLSTDTASQRILEVIEAHGGLQAWYSAPTSSYVWEYSNHASDTRFASRLVVDNQTRRTYHDLIRFGTPESVQEVEARFAWDGEEAWMSPAEREQPNPRFWSLTGFYFQSIPFVLADPGVRFLSLPAEELDGVPHERVMAYFGSGVGDSPGDVYVVYIDPDTDRVAAVLYTVTYGRAVEWGPDGPEAPENGTLLHYQDYTVVDGLATPTRFRGYAYRDGEAGDLRNEAWVSEISFREPFDDSMLEMPADARIEPYSVE